MKKKIAAVYVWKIRFLSRKTRENILTTITPSNMRERHWKNGTGEIWVKSGRKLNKILKGKALNQIVKLGVPLPAVL
jgi:hypothetical protein